MKKSKDPKHQRAFDRDEAMGLRLPRGHKERLREAARKSCRDMSSLVIEFIGVGLDSLERKTAHPGQ